MSDFASCNYSNIRRIKDGTRQDLNYLYVQGCTVSPEGLHKNCIGCQHIVDKKCKFIRFPKQRKWPCYFRTNCLSSSVG